MKKILQYLLAILPLLSISMHSFLMKTAFAANNSVFTGDNTLGLPPAANIKTGSSNSNIADIAQNILMELIKYVGLFAVSIIVIAGILLVVSAGNDDLRERARKMIIYVAVGSLVILFAASIVTFFITIGT